MDNDTAENIYGKGWAFPVSFLEDGKGVKMEGGFELIKQSLIMLFNTHAGERIMRAEYGTQLRMHLFDNVSDDLRVQIKSSLADTIARYEPRVRIEDIDITPKADEPSFLYVTLVYTLTGNDTEQRLNGVIDLNNGMETAWK